MQTIILSNGELKLQNIKNTLEELQGIVGGYIEIPLLSRVFKDNDIDVIINEEGKYIEGLKPEIAIVSGGNGQILDLVYGNCVFASHDEQGNTVSLNDEQIKIIKAELKNVILTNQDTEEIQFIKALVI
jgi:hypothetical protein